MACMASASIVLSLLCATIACAQHKWGGGGHCDGQGSENHSGAKMATGAAFCRMLMLMSMQSAAGCAPPSCPLGFTDAHLRPHPAGSEDQPIQLPVDTGAEARCELADNTDQHDCVAHFHRVLTRIGGGRVCRTSPRLMDCAAIAAKCAHVAGAQRTRRTTRQTMSWECSPLPLRLQMLAPVATRRPPQTSNHLAES